MNSKSDRYQVMDMLTIKSMSIQGVFHILEQAPEHIADSIAFIFSQISRRNRRTILSRITRNKNVNHGIKTIIKRSLICLLSNCHQSPWQITHIEMQTTTQITSDYIWRRFQTLLDRWQMIKKGCWIQQDHGGILKKDAILLCLRPRKRIHDIHNLKLCCLQILEDNLLSTVEPNIALVPLNNLLNFFCFIGPDVASLESLVDANLFINLYSLFYFVHFMFQISLFSYCEYVVYFLILISVFSFVDFMIVFVFVICMVQLYLLFHFLYCVFWV